MGEHDWKPKTPSKSKKCSDLWITRSRCILTETVTININLDVISKVRNRTLQIVVLKSNAHQFRKTRYGNWYNPYQLVVSELQIGEIYAFGKVRDGTGDTRIARVERSQVYAFGQITRNLPWAEFVISSWRLDILAKDGKGPEREFFWTESDRRDASCVSSEGRLPEMDWESRLMESTLPVELSQLTLVQVHGSLEADQPEGAGESAAKSLDMTAASSQNETDPSKLKDDGLSMGASEFWPEPGDPPPDLKMRQSSQALRNRAKSRHRTLQIVVLKSNVHQFRKTRNGNWYNPGQLVVSELQIEEIYAFGKVLEIRERIEEVRNDAGDTGVARVERSQVCAFGQITRNLPWAELAIVGNAESPQIGKTQEEILGG
nr:hypothetical protein Iba_chr12cCG9160 [Ipomoea batatas]